MDPECYFTASWSVLKTDPPCPPCNEALASRLWPDYYREIHPESVGQDLFLCAAHASWLMERSIIAVREIRLISDPDPPAVPVSATPPAPGRSSPPEGRTRPAIPPVPKSVK